jgi:hypothetical protein
MEEQKQLRRKIVALKSRVKRLGAGLLKTCARCRLEMDADQFYRDARYADGRYPYCKECKTEMATRYYKKRKVA